MLNISRFLSVPVLTGLMMAGGAQTMAAPAVSTPEVMIDLNGVNLVRVGGSNTRVSFTADPAVPAGVTVVDHGGKNCTMNAEIERRGDALLITFVQQQRGFSFGFVTRCDPRVSINLAPGTNLDVNLEKVVAEFSGAYGVLQMKTADAVISFDGQANAVDISGHQLAATLILNNTEGTDHLRVNARKLVIDLGVAEGARLAYQVNAPVSLFNRGVTEAADGMTLQIASDVLKGSTYFAASAR